MAPHEEASCGCTPAVCHSSGRDAVEDEDEEEEEEEDEDEDEEAAEVDGADAVVRLRISLTSWLARRDAFIEVPVMIRPAQPT